MRMGGKKGPYTFQNQSVITTLLAGAHGLHSHYSGLLSSVLRVSQHLPCRCILFFLLEAQSSYTSGWSFSFHVLPVFLLAQIL